MEKNISEKTQAKGEYTYLSLKRDPTADEITLLRRYTRGDKTARADLKDLIESETEVRNIVPTVGRTVLARRLTGDTVYTGAITHGAFGSGSTAFTNASTQLNTEVYRKVVSDSAFDGNIAYIDWFINTADVANQTFNEFGAFIDGSGSANSGQAFSLVVTGGWVKSGAMFISLKVTFS